MPNLFSFCRIPILAQTVRSPIQCTCPTSASWTCLWSQVKRTKTHGWAMQRTRATWESPSVVHPSPLATLVRTATPSLTPPWSSTAHAAAPRLKHLTCTCALSPRSPSWSLKNPSLQSAIRTWQRMGWQRSNVFLGRAMIVCWKKRQILPFCGMTFLFSEL